MNHIKRPSLIRMAWMFAAIITCCALTVSAQIPQPKDVIGFTPGDDRHLASWSSIVEYFKKLDTASDRVIFQEIGKTTMGAPFTYATISSPENLRNLEKYKQINAKLADPRTFRSSDAVARSLIKQGKTIVLITCGIHSDEVGSTLSSMLIAYRLASSDEPEIKKVLDNTIILLVPSLNPDGVDIIKNWYDKTLGTKFEGTSPPELYHKYVGHDDNRDWYAFTQVETRITVEKIHNVWHPQIVNDIHQQGETAAGLFLPPYMQPVEPNVPKEVVEGYTELGNYIAADLRGLGLQGITTNSTYDAWTPSRAYSHYHGGVRILSETASCKLATPVDIKFDTLRSPPELGYDPQVESPHFGPLWRGGKWNLNDVTRYMTSAAFSLLGHAANNREKWLERFYAIGKRSVMTKKPGELAGYILPARGADTLESILYRSGVTIEQANGLRIKGKAYPDNTKIVRLDQPYGGFAKALIEAQVYPNLKDAEGNPVRPYDVTAHTLPLLTGIAVEPVYEPFRYKQPAQYIGYAIGRPGDENPSHTAIYRSHIPAIDEGWTRWVFEQNGLDHDTATNENINSGKLFEDRSEMRGIKRIVFPDQPYVQIRDGFAKGSMPPEYMGGIGRSGVANLRKFVEGGGTLVFLNRASSFAIEQFYLPIDDITHGEARKNFFIPGSILRTELDTTKAIASGMPERSIAWFENGPVFEIAPYSGGGSGPLAPNEVITADKVTVIARYPADASKVLLSGWALGTEKIAGKAALVSIKMGKGKIVLFGFRPQYRGQSTATFPLLFNAIED